MLAERYILLDSLLFKNVTTPEKEMVVLAILGMCANIIITLYHSSLFAGHQGVIKNIPYNELVLYIKLNTLLIILY